MLENDNFSITSNNNNIFSKPQNINNINTIDNNMSTILEQLKQQKHQFNSALLKLKTDYENIISSKDKELRQYVTKLASKNDKLSLDNLVLSNQIQSLKNKNNIYYQILSTSTSPFSSNDNSIETTLNSIRKNTEIKTQTLTDKYNKTLSNYKQGFEEVNTFCNSYNLPETVLNFVNEIKQYIISYQTQITELLNKIYEQEKLEIVLTNTKDVFREENAYLKYKLITEKHDILMELYNIKNKHRDEINSVKRNFTSLNFLKDNSNLDEILFNEKKNNIEVISLYQKVNVLSNENKELNTKFNELIINNEELIHKINEMNEINEKLTNEKEDYELQLCKLNEKVYNLTQSNQNYQKEINEIKLELNQKENNIISLLSTLKVKESSYKTEIKQLQNKLNSSSIINNNRNNFQINNISTNINKDTLISSLHNEKKSLSSSTDKLIYAYPSQNETSSKINKDALISKYEKDIHILNQTKDNLNKELSEIKSFVNKLYEVVIQFDSKNIEITKSNKTKESIQKLEEINNTMEKVLMYMNNQKELNSKLNIYENEIQKLKNRVNSLLNLSLNNVNKTTNNMIFPQNISKLSQIQFYEKIVKYIHDLKIYHEIQIYKLIIKNEENNSLSSQLQYNNISDLTTRLNNIENQIQKNNDEFNERIKNFLLIETAKTQISDIQKQYENIIASLFEKFLSYNTSNQINSNTFILLKIPINEYNGIIESAMQSIDYIIKSISNWYMDIKSTYEKTVTNIYDNLINMTTIKSEINPN